MQYFNSKPIRLIELFAGIGSQAKALTNLGVDFEHYRVCEFDKYAISAYNAVHGTEFETSDITQITADDLNITDTEHFTYLLTYSFPCQDLSNAGLGKGMEKGSGTRSGLLWEVERLLNECTELPQVLLMENVPQVHGKKNIKHFNQWIEFLESKGYSNHWKDLNSKDYGVPQSRNRCFMVSILGDYSFEFPAAIPLTSKLKDVLDEIVDEKYYLSDTQIDKMKKTNFTTAKYERRVTHSDCVMSTLMARDYKDPKCVEIPTSELKRTLCNTLLENGLVEEGDVIRHSYTNNRLNNGVDNMKRTESVEKLSPTLDTRCDCLGVVVKEPTELQKEVCNKAMEQNMMKPYDIIDYTYSNARLDEIKNGKIKTKNSENNQISNTITTNAENMGVCVPNKINVVGNYSPSGHEASRGVHSDGLAPTIKENHGTVTATLEPQSLRIRKLTPKECWRLMGFDDESFHRAEKVVSNSQLYKQAGNSIVVDVLMAIFKELFVPKKTRSEWLFDLLS